MRGRLGGRIVEALRRDFVAGLLVIVPAGFTILALLWTLEQLDRLVLPRIAGLLGFEDPHPRAVGIAVTLLAVLAAGWTTRTVAGRTFLHLWERFVERVPVARSLYAVLKRFMQAVVGLGDETAFRRVVLIEYPRRGVYSYAFVTGRETARAAPDGRTLLRVFVPSTPNPTTGYFLLVPEDETLPTELGVEDAFRVIISAGIAGGEELARRAAEAAAAGSAAARPASASSAAAPAAPASPLGAGGEREGAGA